MLGHVTIACQVSLCSVYYVLVLIREHLTLCVHVQHVVPVRGHLTLDHVASMPYLVTSMPYLPIGGT